MTSYARSWLRFWTVVTATGLGFALLVVKPGPLVVWSLIAASVIAVLPMLRGGAVPGATARLSSDDVQTVALRAAGGAVAVVGGGAWLAASPAIFTGLLVVGAISSPWMVDLAGRLTRGPEPPDPRGLTTSHLCVEWQRTFVLLQNQVDARDLAATAALRRAYLDEMERRSPSGIRAWLRSGAHPACSPAEYLITASEENEDTHGSP